MIDGNYLGTDNDLAAIVRAIEAARALGLDCGPMSGFDNAKVDEEFFGAGKECEGCEHEFFPSGHVKSNFLCNLGYGDESNRKRGEDDCRAGHGNHRLRS